MTDATAQEKQTADLIRMHVHNKADRMSSAIEALRGLSPAERRMVMRVAEGGNPNKINHHLSKYRDDLYRNLGG